VPPLAYLIMRFARRFTPASVMQWMLSRNVGVKAGLETRDAAAAVGRYHEALQGVSRSWDGARVLILGYGGHFGLAVKLLEQGAAHVILLDPYATLKHQANLALTQTAGEFLCVQKGEAVPNPQFITLAHDSLEAYAASDPSPLDLVLSWSVYEHLPDPEGVTRQLARLTSPHGAHVHFIDLRDHYFRHPFEMLCYRESIWQRFLNPPSNLNRLRAWDYQSIFAACFHQVEVRIVERDLESFERTQSRIRPEFICGDLSQDAAVRICVCAHQPERLGASARSLPAWG